jgi:hypothetical protein
MINRFIDKNKHKGQQPVRVLYPILESFSDDNKTEFQKFLKDNKIDNIIQFRYEKSIN